VKTGVHSSGIHTSGALRHSMKWNSQEGGRKTTDGMSVAITSLSRLIVTDLARFPEARLWIISGLPTIRSEGCRSDSSEGPRHGDEFQN